MRMLSIVFVMLSAFCAAASAADEKGLVAHWDFDEGSGDVVKDRSGNGNNGTTHGGQWVRLERGYALALDGIDDYVDCGKGKSLDLRNALTIEAWVNRDAAQPSDAGVVIKAFNSYGFTFYSGLCCFYISSGSNRLDIGPWTPGEWHHIVLTFDGKAMKGYLDASSSEAVKRSRPSASHIIGPGANLYIGKTPKTPALNRNMFFKGMIDEVRIYNRALSEREVGARYRQGAWRRGEGREMKLTPYFYLEEGEVCVNLNLRGLMPLGKGGRAGVELGPAGKGALETKTMAPVPESGEGEFTFKVAGLPPGTYEIRAVVEDEQGIRSEDRITFRYPRRPPTVVSPKERTLPPLPAPAELLPYGFRLWEGGGFEMTLKGEKYAVESSFSYPRGGNNKLAASQARDAEGEKSWKLTVERVGAAEYKVHAQGRYYAIDRRILLRPNHISVRETVRNLTSEDVGIVIRNCVNTEGKKFDDLYLNGVKRPRGESGAYHLFISRKGLGIGFIALDDVFRTQARAYFDGESACFYTDKFGLAKGASYTIEWAIYPNGSGDYYDFINEVRKDEGLNRKVDGCFAFIGRSPPSPRHVELRALKYASVGCLSNIADDPGISVEGIEFMEYPKQMALLKKMFEETHRRTPGLKVMFHVAHNLYVTNRPNETYPDARAIDSAGKHKFYPLNYSASSNFSKQRVEEGWRWYLYYATADNSFGKAMLKAVDVMMDEMGCDGVYYDGFPLYAGTYTYDRWDGHTVEIDPDTKTIRRRLGSVVLLSQDLLVAVARRIKSKGGVLMVNGGCRSRALAGEDITFFTESGAGANQQCAALHLAPTPVMLGSPAICEGDIGVYRDIRGKLDWGCLYYYYGERGITHKTVTSQMFPITIEEIHSGHIKGKERLITSRSGVYGWQGDEDLHLAYLYDARGRLVPADFLTTVDRSGARTEIALKEKETAVLKKIPVALDFRRPINLVALQYDGDAIRLVLNGKGKATVRVRDGDFRIEPGAFYLVKTDTVKKVRADERGEISFDVALGGQTSIRIERERGR